MTKLSCCVDHLKYMLPAARQRYGKLRTGAAAAVAKPSLPGLGDKVATAIARGLPLLTCASASVRVRN